MKKKRQTKPKTTSEKVVGKIEKSLRDNPNGNPFKGLKFTPEERLFLASCGVV